MTTRAVTLALALLLGAGCGSRATPEPPAAAGPELVVGATAPATTVTRSDGAQVALAQTWAGRRAAVVVFYRGFY